MIPSNKSLPAKKTAPNQADNIEIFWSCLLPKMRLSVVLEGRNIGYNFIVHVAIPKQPINQFG